MFKVLRAKSRILFFLAFFVLSAAAPNPADLNAPSGSDSGWPRQFTSQNENFTIYQPQIEKWENNQLEERAAVAVQGPAQAEPTYGVIWITARTEVDKTTHLVTLEDVQIPKVNFPSAQEKSNDYLAVFKQQAPDVLKPVSLDRLQAGLAVTRAEAKHKTSNLKNTPPKVYYSSSPSILVLIDGKPALRETGSPDVLRVINTRALILLDQRNGHYYFNLDDRWLTSTDLNSWKMVKLPADLVQPFKQTKQSAVQAKEVDPLNNPEVKASLAKGVAPKIIVSTQPAELVQTRGSPQFQPVADTSLLYVKNAAGDIFLNTSDQNYYVLISGRWYRSKSLEGQWNYVASSSLPPDFSKIPESHPKGDVLASVSGTPQAQEAQISNEIPQTATIRRQQAGVAVGYDGSPEFRPIEGTPLQYAVNSGTPVIEVDPQSFYSVQNGVWFVATTQGP
jgi:hypothetical protein